MLLYLQRKKANVSFKIIIGCIVLSFLASIIAGNFSRNSAKSYAAYLPAPTQLIPLSANFNPPVLRGITIHPEDPFVFDFIIDSGDKTMSQDELKKASKKLIRHFLASLTIPEEDLWVNLSPYEAEKIAPNELGITEMGRDMLAQDYILKQLLSSVTYPESPMGKAFWNKVYEKAYQVYGTTNIPINTFNKIWIIPEKALVYENGASAYVLESRLKVMLEEDYVALSNNLANSAIGTDKVNTDEAKQLNDISSSVMKEIILPEIEKEINEGENFAPLRQIYNSLILAVWFKDKLRGSIINQIYTDKRKVKGVDLSDKAIKEKIYNRYLEAYKQGVYDYVKTEYDPNLSKNISRRYYSGGLDFAQVSSKVDVLTSPPIGGIPQGQSTASVTVRTTPADGGGSGVGSGTGTASGVGQGSGGNSLVLETEEYKERLKEQLESLSKDLKRARADRRLIKALDRALRILEKIESGDFSKHGYDQIAKVLFHGYSHAVNNTNQAILALHNAAASVRARVGVDIPSDAIVIVALAAMYHDVGYYKLDSYGFGTIKVGHEQRSKEFVRTFAKKLGINPSFVPLICLVISSTQANVKEGFWNELQTAVEALLQDQNNTQAVQRLEELLVQAKDENHAGSSLGILEDRSGNLALNQKDLSLFLGIILGAKALASLDIYDTRENAIEMIEGLRLEFAHDKQRLLNWLAQNSNFSEDDIGTFQVLSDKGPINIILTAENSGILDSTHTETEKQLFAKAMGELLGIHAADTHAQQVTGTKGFFEFYADGRVNDLGIWGFVDGDARREFEVKRGIIYELAEEGRIGELSQRDIARLREQVEEEAVLSQEVLAKRAEQAFAAEGLRYHTSLTPERLAAVERAHQVGEGHSYEIGSDGRPVKHSNPNEAYTAQEIAKKARILREAGFSIEEIDVLIRYGVVGNSSASAANAERALQQTTRISQEMEQAARDAFNIALEAARQQRPDYAEDFYDNVALLIAGSVARREAVRETDIDYAITLTANGGHFARDRTVREALKLIRDRFAEELAKRGITDIDTNLEERLRLPAIRMVDLTTASSLFLDAKVLAGNTEEGQAALRKAAKTIPLDAALLHIEARLDKLFSEKDSYEKWSIKENKRELDYLLFMLRMLHNVGAKDTKGIISELVQEQAITQQQGQRILTQIGKLLQLRLMASTFIRDENLAKHVQDEGGAVVVLEEYLANEMGMSRQAFRAYYISLVSESRAIIKEIMGKTQPTITEEVSALMQSIPEEIVTFASANHQFGHIFMQIALVFIGAKPAYFADRYDALPATSQLYILQLASKYGVRVVNVGQNPVIYREAAIQQIIDRDAQFYRGLTTVHRGQDAESILEAAVKQRVMGELLGYGSQRSIDESLGLLEVKVGRRNVVSFRAKEAEAHRLGEFYKAALERITQGRIDVSYSYTATPTVAYQARQAFQSEGLRHHTSLTEERLAAIQRAHQVGEGHSYELAPDGRPTKNSDPSQAYTSQEIAKKARILQEAGFTREEIDALIRRGVVGNASASSEAADELSSSSPVEIALDFRSQESNTSRRALHMNNFVQSMANRLEEEYSSVLRFEFDQSLEGDSAPRALVWAVSDDSVLFEDISVRYAYEYMKRIFKYVVANALYFKDKTDKKLEVKITTRLRPDGRVAVTIADNGPGVNFEGIRDSAIRGREQGVIDKESVDIERANSGDREYILSLLFVDSVSDKQRSSPHINIFGHEESQGMGVGLWSIVEIIEESQGTIEVETTPGKGTAFTFVFDSDRPQDGQSKLSSNTNAHNLRPTHAAGNVGSSQKTGNPGGIDFNPQNLTIETRGSIDVSTLNVPFDVQSFEGFTFNIIRVETIDDLNSAAIPQDTEFKNLSYLP